MKKNSNLAVFVEALEELQTVFGNNFFHRYADWSKGHTELFETWEKVVDLYKKAKKPEDYRKKAKEVITDIEIKGTHQWHRFEMALYYLARDIERQMIQGFPAKKAPYCFLIDATNRS